MGMKDKIENLREMKRLQSLLTDEIERNRLELKKDCNRKCGNLQSKITYYSGCYYDKGYDQHYDTCDVCGYFKHTKQETL